MTDKLKQIEADVVLIGRNAEKGTAHCLCLWECDMTPAQLMDMATTTAHEWNEADGGGSVSVQIHDYRPIVT